MGYSDVDPLASSLIQGLRSTDPAQAVLFDVNGTLVDIVDLHAQTWIETLHHFRLDAGSDDIGGLIGEGGDQLLLELLPSDMQEDMATFRADFTLGLGA